MIVVKLVFMDKSLSSQLVHKQNKTKMVASTILSKTRSPMNHTYFHHGLDYLERELFFL
jgi:hypothetical protein